MPWTIERAGSERAADVFEGVALLLAELGAAGEATEPLDRAALLDGWSAFGDRLCAFLAADEVGRPLGVLTLVESFAIYAGGPHGIINELYVSAPARSLGVGAALIDAAGALGRARGWRRLEVAVPASTGLERARRFYAAQGFVSAGPKLKKMLGDAGTPGGRQR